MKLVVSHWHDGIEENERERFEKKECAIRFALNAVFVEKRKKNVLALLNVVIKMGGITRAHIKLSHVQNHPVFQEKHHL